ncbi:TadE-like protein [Nocardioides alpinus]|uniref:Pilus assembly protein n=1 Tax=Nocardioides alpinus TaxID=748909 RepID=A0A1I0X636_9ACTN|nr:TadE/TadG family type IV pilus assembly protein [Nocardioides alpinus]PKH44098.1 pilus assembly protein [Nocardioides alpinus]SFA95493.1 TadE-like protein [Nocardioides alpinus]
MRRRKNRERGAAAVEFALVSLILMTLVGVIFQFAIYLWAFQAASNGAREGARAWAVNPCATTNSAKVLTAVSPAARTGSVTATAAFVKGAGNIATGREPGDQVTVTVKMKAKALGFNLVPGWDYNANITKTATARVEDVQGCP